MKKTIALCLTTCLCAALLVIGAAAQPGTCIIKPGDTLDSIAKRYQINIDELRKCNPQLNENNLKPGQSVAVPNVDNLATLEEEVAQIVNRERISRGLPVLSYDAELCRLARLKSQDFINKKYFAHQSPTYGSPFEMLKNNGIKYTSAGENIAKGQPTPVSVMNAWMNSPGHRGNILSTAFTKIGVGAAKDAGGNLYWTQLFIR